MKNIVHLDIATMLPTKRQGAGTSDWEKIGDGNIVFVSGEPCVGCKTAVHVRDRHSICDLMLDKG